ncbi:hypothetical protein HDE_04853 [Halotydeus destructor]|nr:hypothetical protein HDE_04853 [Halotydeus destructor]
MSETMSIDAISHDIKGLAVSRKSTGNVSPKELSYQWTIKRDWSRDCELSSPEFQVRGNKNGAWYMSLWDKDDHLDISLSLNGEAHQGTKVKLIFYFSVCNSNDDVIWTKTVAVRICARQEMFCPAVQRIVFS